MIRTRPIVITTALVALITPALQATPLQLADVLVSTRSKHPLIDKAAAKVRAAEGKQDAAIGIFDPLLRAQGDITPYGDYQTGKGQAELRQQTPLWGLALFGGWRLGRGEFPIYKRVIASVNRLAASTPGRHHPGR